MIRKNKGRRRIYRPDMRMHRLARTLTIHSEVAEWLQRADFEELERRVLRATAEPGGVGPHVEAASFMYGVPPHKVTESMRRSGRIVSLAVMYRMQRNSLQQLIAKVFEEMPNGKVVQEQQKSI